MKKDLQEYINRSARLLAGKQVDLGFIPEDQTAAFIRDFVSGIGSDILSDDVRHAEVAFRVVYADAQVRKICPKAAAAQFVSTFEQSARQERPAASAAGTPAVPVAQSLQHDHIVCLEDGKKVKLLKRYLRTYYGMSPDQYRDRWGLPGNYPMVPGIREDIRKRLVGDALDGSRKAT